jgi:chaperonin cofactor prefoldin
VSKLKKEREDLEKKIRTLIKAEDKLDTDFVQKFIDKLIVNRGSANTMRD